MPKTPNPHAAALGRIGGPAGARARALVLSPDERSTIARLAANSRWGKDSPPPKNVPVTVRFDPDDLVLLDRLAAGGSRSAVLRSGLLELAAATAPRARKKPTRRGRKR